MKKMISVGLAAVLLTLSIAGCSGSKSAESAGESSATEAGGQETAADDSAKSKIQIMGPWVVESPEDEILAGVVEGFEKEHPEYEVELIGVPSADLLTNVQSMAASDTLPDLVITNGANNAAWKEMDIVADISR